MTSKPETIAQLKRKIERLEARIAMLETDRERHWEVAKERLYAGTDAQIRIRQALRILTGEDDL